MEKARKCHANSDKKDYSELERGDLLPESKKSTFYTWIISFWANTFSDIYRSFGYLGCAAQIKLVDPGAGQKSATNRLHLSREAQIDKDTVLIGGDNLILFWAINNLIYIRS